MMPKYYDATEVNAVFEKLEDSYGGTSFIMGIYAAHNCITKIKTADVEPVVHAHWVKSELSRYRDVYICSRCARTVSTPLGVSFDVVLDENPYCHCGAKMDEEVKEDA